jgi:DNA-binding NarL/FixJ family response regulator
LNVNWKKGAAMTIKISEIFPTLTPRQAEVCALMVQGIPNKDIGRRLGISHRTIEDHREEVYRRAEVRNAGELAYKAMGRPEVCA